MKRILLLLVMLITIGAQAAFAQSRTLSGKVVDENGEGLPGASVKVKGTESGAITDIEGNFQISLPEGHEVLEVNTIGYVSEEINVSDPSQSLTVRLVPGRNQTIGEVEIYGQRIDPRKNTGSVTTITAEEIERKPITNVIRALDGAAGIKMTSGGGQPGSTPAFTMRGIGSLSASTAPLIVVDGTVYNGSLSSINKNDVESMTLLKDASASSLYGSRGANGVIMITTKRGATSDKPRISVSGQTGIVNRMLAPMETIDEREYYEMGYQMWKNYLVANGGQAPDQPLSLNRRNQLLNTIFGGYNPFNKSIFDLFDENGKVVSDATLRYDDDWMEELSRNGLRHEYNVSVSNGNEKGDYYFSVGYNNDEGIVKYTDYERITTNLRVNAQVASWLRSGISLMGSYEDQRNFVGTSNAFSNPFMTAQTMGPIFPIYQYDEDGNRLSEPDGSPAYDFGDNPEKGESRHFGKNTNIIASLQYDDRTNKTYTARGVGFLEAKFLKDFRLRTDLSLDYINYNNNFYGSSEYGDFSTMGGLIQKRLYTQLSYTFRQMLVWEPSFGIFAKDHSLAVTLNHENYLLSNNSYFIERLGFTGPEFKEGAAAAVAGSSSSSFDQLAMESYLALGSYNYKGKYFFMASVRQDGTSRFSPQARWGTFWSVSGGWGLAEESFIRDNVDWLSNLKLRASYGIQGNENLGGNYYSWLPRYFFNANGSRPGYLFNSWGNPELVWESQYTFDVGVDVGVLNDRFTASIDYFDRGSSDLLYVRPFAPSTGIGGIQDNVGSMRNYGVEFEFKGDVIRKRDFIWNAQLTLQHVSNKITKMQADDSIVGTHTLMAKGEALGSWFLPRYAGVDKTNGDELWYLADGSTTNNYNTASAAENREVMGSAFRDLEGSFTSSFMYKGFDLSFQVNFGIGGKFYDGVYATLMQPGSAYQGRAWHPDILNSWSYDNPDGTLPRLDIGDPDLGNASDRFLIDASFLKIQNINLGYTFSGAWTENLKISNLRVYVAADNVFLLAARKGLDIQQSLMSSSDLLYYPYRSIMFGVNIGL